MDLAIRKYKCIEKLMEIKSEEKLKQLEAFISEDNSGDAIVAHSINGEPITREDYIEQNKKALEQIKQGKSYSSKELLDYFQKMSKND